MGSSSSKRREEERRREEAARLEAERKRREEVTRRQLIEYARLQAEAERRREQQRQLELQSLQAARLEAERKRREEVTRRQLIEYARLQAEAERRREQQRQLELQSLQAARLEAERKRREEVTRRQLIEYARLQAEAERRREQQRQLELQSLQHERILAHIALERQQRERAKSLLLGRLKKHKVNKNLDLINDFRKAFNLTPLNRYPHKPYSETQLLKTSQDYIRASVIFKTSNKPFFTISKINKVDNTFHAFQYELMKDKYQNCYGELTLSEKLMFHGTKTEFLDSICTYNFDRSKVVNHMFGHGISFARDSYFSTHYHRDNQRNPHKVMIITKMFWGKLDPGTESMVVPNRPSYASANADQSVIVKYDDASFYPLYIVYYDGLHSRDINMCD